MSMPDQLKDQEKEWNDQHWWNVLMIEVILYLLKYTMIIKKIWRLNSEEITHVDIGALRVKFSQVIWSHVSDQPVNHN